LNTTLQFDVALYGPVSTTPGTAAYAYTTRFQNNIASIFSRVRLLYGATPLEDIINYNVIVRALTEWTSTNPTNTMDQTSIAEGIGGYVLGADSTGVFGDVNVRQRFIQGLNTSAPAAPANFTGGQGFGYAPQATDIPSGAPAAVSGQFVTTRRYQLNFALGLFTQDKLIPTKFMASQLAIEITLEQAQACIYAPYQGVSVTGTPSYIVGNVNLIPEILEFDASYGKILFLLKIFRCHVSPGASDRRCTNQVCFMAHIYLFFCLGC
jgi:hypothetical protein